MKDVRKDLKTINQEEFSHISPRVKEKQIELDEINCKGYGGNIHSNVLRKTTNLNGEYIKLCDAERELY
ncbi:hypothetical protein LIER_04837 [Lithospermum erythrorhizon]|uniref:Uncharacterized protein n=1 Tax=Lithospermum erythrorhizon TaxID=34254 RepID=A0AAV3NY72_LITER